MSSAVLRVLLYYDLFTYPLTVEEITRHCSRHHCTVGEVQQTLNALCEGELIFNYEHFYGLKKDVAVFERRLRGNQAAEQIMHKARKRASFIAGFPFVRSVCVSGSLSKDYFDETTDIDFFIITEPGRLWVCRSVLIFFKKIFLFNSKKYFCVNYFIGSETLEIPDRNIFTATELITLLPFYNRDLYEQFFNANSWVKEFYPNSKPRQNPLMNAVGNHRFRKFIESIINVLGGKTLDRFLYQFTHDHWKKKFNTLNKEEFEVNMRSKKNVSKHHPQGFQFRVLNLFEENCRAFEERHQLILH
jgi:hypothetical protein